MMRLLPALLIGKMYHARALHGQPLSSPPLIERIAKDPALRGVKLIAEPWDCGGLYQVGFFFLTTVCLLSGMVSSAIRYVALFAEKRVVWGNSPRDCVAHKTCTTIAAAPFIR